MNRVTLFGRVGADPELKTTTGGTAVLRLRVATSERIKSGEEWTDHTEWHSVSIWGKKAERLAKHLGKGSQLLIEGVLRTREWVDREDVKRYSTEINAQEVFFGAKPGDTSNERRDGESRRDSNRSNSGRR